MLIALALSTFSFVLAAAVSDRAYLQRRVRRPARSSSPERSGQWVPVLVRTGRVGAQLARPVRGVAQVAPASAADSALHVTDAAGKILVNVVLAQVVTARGWSRGALMLEYNQTRGTYNSPWPAGRNIAGWELHLLTYSGETIRCYGSPGTSLDADLSRLQDSLRRGRLLRAS